eukprot:TRINITY_DN5101_c0_g1_i1.p1 TRINITY_DN5101_c0_g1~~TRINITY_DN5101_c0_g1_i1.p1  ORF type:complete len:937 (+),score=159.92 TRINITY_DN5101_c0_g1_i1:60-2870(+)
MEREKDRPHSPKGRRQDHDRRRSPRRRSPSRSPSRKHARASSSHRSRSSSRSPSRKHVGASSSRRSRSSSRSASPSRSEEMALPTLPIHGVKDQLIDMIDKNTTLVVVGETGSGKTTQLPQILANMKLLRKGPSKEAYGNMIAVTQPRRVAAISCAVRVAEELGVAIGEEVGYSVRFDDRTSSKTVIRYMTDGCLLRECLQDPELTRYCAIVLDEAHERSLQTDILFGLLKSRFVDQSRTDLKIIVMSATLDENKFAEFFKAPIFFIEGITYPVDIAYYDRDVLGIGVDSSDEEAGLKKPSGHSSSSRRNVGMEYANSNYVTRAVDAALFVHKNLPPGGILVFLTGQQEIEQACQDLSRRSHERDRNALRSLSDDEDDNGPGVYGKRKGRHNPKDDIMILPCYGALTTEEQKRVFQKCDDQRQRKIVIATNIAATSITIEGIKYVVDSGLVKQKQYNAKTGLESLIVVPISKSEAMQRAGRAGRTCEGYCLRLFNQDVYESMSEVTVPEIQRTDLSTVALSLKCAGIDDIFAFQYMDVPDRHLLLQALRQLHILGALNAQGKVTDLGQLLSKFPISLPLGLALFHSSKMKCEREIATIIAMLSVESIFTRPSKKNITDCYRSRLKLQKDSYGNDFLMLLLIYEKWEKAGLDQRDWCFEHYIHTRAMNSARNIRQQLAEMLVSTSQKGGKSTNLGDSSSFRQSSSDAIEMLSTCQKSRKRGDPLGDESVAKVMECLCLGLFANVARRDAVRKHLFRTMDGNATTASIHPNSALFFKKEDYSEDESAIARSDHELPRSIDWVLYYELVQTTKTFISTVGPIRYEWVKELLPKLHQVDEHMLQKSGAILNERETRIIDQQRDQVAEVLQIPKHTRTVFGPQPPGEDNEQEEPATMGIESTGGHISEVEAAKLRYMERKKAKEAAAAVAAAAKSTSSKKK